MDKHEMAMRRLDQVIDTCDLMGLWPPISAAEMDLLILERAKIVRDDFLEALARLDASQGAVGQQGQG